MQASGGGGETEAKERIQRRPRFVPSVSAALRRRSFQMPSRDDVADWLQRQWALEDAARSGFFLIPVGLMIGIVLVHGFGWRIGPGGAAVPAMAAAAMAWRLWGRGWHGVVALLLAAVAVGIALAAAELALTRTIVFSGEATVRIEGRVLWRDRDEKDRIRYLLRIEKTERPVLSRPPEIASILVSSRHATIPVGGRLRGLVRLRAPSGPAYPGAYDFAFGSYFEGRGANGFALGAPERADDPTGGLTAGERLVTLRLWMSDRIRAVIGGGAGAVASALITGERSGIPDDIDEWLRATGLSHVLSISGLHMALVAGFAMVLVRGALAAVPGAALVLPTKKIGAVAALFVATVYLVISGSDVATDRSYVMLSVMLLAILADRPALMLRNIAIAAVVVLVTTPHAVVTASFQMSFAATLALVGIYGAYAKWRAARPGGITPDSGIVMTALVFLAGLAASSAIAGTATAPYAAYHFQRIAPYGVIANLVALPVFSFWIMPLALIAVLLMPFGLDAPFLVLIGTGLDLVFAMAKILATHLPDGSSGRLTPAGVLVFTAALLLSCLSASRLRWFAVPIALCSVLALPSRTAPPDLLVFEDGRDLATIDGKGRLHSLRRRPNDFVFNQWERAFGERFAAAANGETAGPGDFTCEPSPAAADEVAERPNVGAAETTTGDLAASATAPSAAPATIRPQKPRLLCRATTRSGIRIVWTDDYRLTGLACDEADIAIVARATAVERCRSGARLVTLRTLRRSGSLAISGAEADGPPIVKPSVGDRPEDWNLHRLAPWPEHWRNPAKPAGHPVQVGSHARSAGTSRSDIPHRPTADSTRSASTTDGAKPTEARQDRVSTSESIPPAGPAP